MKVIMTPTWSDFQNARKSNSKKHTCSLWVSYFQMSNYKRMMLVSSVLRSNSKKYDVGFLYFEITHLSVQYKVSINALIFSLIAMLLVSCKDKRKVRSYEPVEILSFEKSGNRILPKAPHVNYFYNLASLPSHCVC